MRHHRRAARGCLGALIIAAIASTGVAATPASTSRDEQIAALEAELQRLKAAKQADLRAEQIRLLSEEAASDAAQHSFYQVEECIVCATPGKGLEISSPDGETTMRFGFYSQFRYVINIQEDVSDNPDGNVDGYNSGFEFRRLRLYMIGTMHSNLDYCILTDFTPSGGLTLLDAHATYRFDDNWSIQVGQFPMPLLNELTVPVPLQQVSELTTTLGLTRAGRTRGINLYYKADDFALVGSYNTGTGSRNTDWNSDAVEFAFTGRGEVKLWGEWDEMLDFTSFRDSGSAGVIGAAAHYEDGDAGDGATPGSFGSTAAAPGDDRFLWTVDGQFEWPGYNIYAVATGIHTNAESPGEEDTDDFTYLLQGGVFLTDDFEVFGTVEYIDLDVIEDDPAIITLGVNKYFNGHANKLTIDGGFATEPIPVEIASDRTALEVDADGEDGQIFLRVQWQLVF